MDSRLGSLNTKVFKAFEYFISMVCKGFQGFLNILVQWFAMQIFQRPPFECSGGKVLWKIEMNYWFSLLTFIILWQDINSNRTSYPLQTLSRAIKQQTHTRKFILIFQFSFYGQKLHSDVVWQKKRPNNTESCLNKCALSSLSSVCVYQNFSMRGVKEFLQSSTIHGLSYIAATDKLTRFFWMFVVLSGFSGAAWIIWGSDFCTAQICDL